MQYLGQEVARQAIHLHLSYNLVVLLLGMLLSQPLTRLLEQVINASASPAPGSERISALDPNALDDPARALVCASREVLHLGETVETMLAPIMHLYRNWDDETAQNIQNHERSVSAMHFETKLYLAGLHENKLSKTEAKQSMELSSTAINLKAAGDVISKNLLPIARKINSKKLQFSPEGWRDLCDFHDQVLSNLQLALNVMMISGVDAARQLVEEKETVREVEQKLQLRHLERLRTGNPNSVETSNFHQETLRALKQINTAVTMVAYAILRDAGELLPSRLIEPHEEHD